MLVLNGSPSAIAACHTVPLTVGNHQFMFLIGLYSFAEIRYFIKKRNENDKNKSFMTKNNKKIPGTYMKALSNIFTMKSPHPPVMKYAPNFRETEKIHWFHFVRRTYFRNFSGQRKIFNFVQAHLLRTQISFPLTGIFFHFGIEKKSTPKWKKFFASRTCSLK